MATIADLHERTNALLTRPPNDVPMGAPAAAGAEPLASSRFMMFFPSHQERALQLAKRLMALANERADDDGLEAVLDEAEAAAQTENIDLVKYALMVFITHHPRGRRLPIPALDRRYPKRIVPSNTEVAAAGLQALGALGAEAQLDYFREDTAINDHHNKWHVVYPFDGQPNPAEPVWSVGAEGSAGRAVLVHAPADARPVRSRAARVRPGADAAARRLSRADPGGLRREPRELFASRAGREAAVGTTRFRTVYRREPRVAARSPDRGRAERKAAQG